MRLFRVIFSIQAVTSGAIHATVISIPNKGLRATYQPLRLTSGATRAMHAMRFSIPKKRLKATWQPLKLTLGAAHTFYAIWFSLP